MYIIMVGASVGYGQKGRGALKLVVLIPTQYQSWIIVIHHYLLVQRCILNDIRRKSDSKMIQLFCLPTGSSLHHHQLGFQECLQTQDFTNPREKNHHGQQDRIIFPWQKKMFECQPGRIEMPSEQKL